MDFINGTGGGDSFSQLIGGIGQTAATIGQVANQVGQSFGAIQNILNHQSTTPVHQVAPSALQGSSSSSALIVAALVALLVLR